LEYNETVHQLFLDFKKAYDSVRREVLYSILIEFGVPMEVVRLTKMCIKEIRSSFPIENGMKQGERMMRWAGRVARIGEEKNAYRLVGKPEGRRPLGRPRRRWMDNIKMDLLDLGWGDVDWIGLAQDSDQWRLSSRELVSL
jgi:hypothetical protein